MSKVHELAAAICVRWKRTNADDLNPPGAAGQLARHAVRLNLAILARDVVRINSDKLRGDASADQFYFIAFDGDTRSIEGIIQAEKLALGAWRQDR